jgi:ABC-type uncharacterized transport system fused permease/ATPase subunit
MTVDKKKTKKAVKVIDILNPLEDAREGVSTTFKLLTSALTLVSALAWNDAIKGIFEMFKEDQYLQQAGIWAPFIYAILVTFVTVIIINRLNKIQDNINKKDSKETK